MMKNWFFAGAAVLGLALPLQAQLWVDIHAAPPPPPRGVVIVHEDHWHDHDVPAARDFHVFSEWDSFERSHADEDYFHRLDPHLIDRTDHWVETTLREMGRDNAERDNLHREQMIFMQRLIHVQHLLDVDRPREAEVELVNAESDLLYNTTFDHDAHRDIDHLRSDRLDDADHADH